MLNLIPQPQSMTVSRDLCRLAPDRFILLADCRDDQQLRIATIIQDDLAIVGVQWQLTASRSGNTDALGLTLLIDPCQAPRPQGYRLLIRPNHIRLVAHDLAGAFYGAMTLKQLVRQAPVPATLPCLEINDWPDIPNRGVMLDISRDKVPSMATLFTLVDLLAQWKVNQFQLYTEHTFAYARHQQVWEHASPMTGEEILRLDQYCRDRYMQLVPNQNSFGHLGRWLRHDRYGHLAETTEHRRCLSPVEPGAIAFVSGLYDELLPHFRSRLFNVGCDETRDLGKEKSAQACEENGVGAVYLDFLLAIQREVQKHGRTIQFWADIVLQHPELISQLPTDLIALNWGYDKDTPFDAMNEQFAAAGIPFYVCPGTSSWNAIAGMTDIAIANNRNAAASAGEFGAVGYLNTDWGPGGHWQPLSVSYLGFMLGAAYSWNFSGNRDVEISHGLALHAFNDPTMTMGKVAADLGNAYRKAGDTYKNQSNLFRILQKPAAAIDCNIGLPGLTPNRLQEARDFITQVTQHLGEQKMCRPDANVIVAELALVADMLRHACDQGLARFETSDGRVCSIASAKRKLLADDLISIMARYRELWMARNRPGGLADSIGRLTQILDIYQDPNLC